MPPADPNNSTFFEHIDELRGRLIRVTAVVFVAMLIAFGFKELLFEFFKLPLVPLTTKHPDVLAALSPIEMFLVYLKLSFVAGLFVTFPYVLWQFWGFVSPALTGREKKAVGPFMVAGTLAFLTGAAFCFYLVLPVGLEVLHAMLPSDVRATYSVSSYFGMTSLMTLVFGVVFDLPVLMVLLARVGILHPATVARSRKGVVVGLFILGAMLTPPDPWTQVMLAGPMWILFEIGLIISRAVVAAKPPPPADTLPPAEDRRRG